MVRRSKLADEHDDSTPLSFIGTIGTEHSCVDTRQVLMSHRPAINIVALSYLAPKVVAPGNLKAAESDPIAKSALANASGGETPSIVSATVKINCKNQRPIMLVQQLEDKLSLSAKFHPSRPDDKASRSWQGIKATALGFGVFLFISLYCGVVSDSLFEGSSAFQ